MTAIYVVIGAGRPLGASLVRVLAGEGKTVRAIVHKVDRVRSILPSSVEIVGVSTDVDSIRRACGDASMIFNCFEPTGTKFSKVLEEMTTMLLLTTIETGARFVLASYLFVSESDNSAAEQEALNTYRAEFAKTLIARFPQIYGPGIKNALLSGVFESVISGKKANWIGKLDVPRSWVYVEDAAAALVSLSRTEKAYGRAWNIAGPGPLSGRQFIQLAIDAAGKKPNIGVSNRGFMFLTSLISSRARALMALPYDYSSAFVINGEGFIREFPSFQYTPHDVAVARTLEWSSEQAAMESNRGGAKWFSRLPFLSGSKKLTMAQRSLNPLLRTTPPAGHQLRL